jgi:hypothetical protein
VVHYTAYYCVQASVPSLFVDIYRFGGLAIGISYLTIVVVGRYPNGKFLGRNYQAIAKRIGFTINKVSRDGITEFLTERAEDKLRILPHRRPHRSASRLGIGFREREMHQCAPLCFHASLVSSLQTFKIRLVGIFRSNPCRVAVSGNLCRRVCGNAAFARSIRW